jgi:hypothetical protein
VLFTVGHNLVDEHKVHYWFISILIPILTDYIYFFALVGVYLLIAMKNFQNLEYQTHRSRFGIIFVLTCMSLAGLLLCFYVFGQLVVCNGFERKFQLSVNFRNDYCVKLLSLYQFKETHG